MSTLTTLEKAQFQDLLGMDSGYVLDYTNKTFADFFLENAKVDIYADKYALKGGSKAKRLRAFWDLESDAVVGRVLSTLLECWSYKNREPSVEDSAHVDVCRRIVERLLSTAVPVGDAEEQFLIADFGCVPLENVKINASLLQVLESRYSEAIRCFNSDAPLAVIILCGSILEGLLLGLASTNPQQFNQAQNCPKDEHGKARPFRDWSLAQFIDVACELGYLTLDVKKFSHCLRDFRNFIHPHQQMTSGFNPDRHTATICLQVLNAGIACLSGDRG